MSQPSQADLAKLQRELNAREDALTKREKLLNDRYSEEAINILDGSIVAREVLRDELQATNDRLTKQITSSKQELEALELSHKERLSKHEKELVKAEQAVKDAESKLKHITRTLADIKDEISDARRYRDEQQAKVDETIQEWNSILVEFRKEADNIQLEKNKLSSDIIRLEQDKAALIDEDEKLQKRINLLDDTYENKVHDYKDRLRELDLEIGQRKNALDTLNVEHEAKIKSISAREKSVKIKEATLFDKENSLNLKERRIKMNYGLAGLNFDDDNE